MYKMFRMVLILLCITTGCQNQHGKNFVEEEQTMVGYVIFKGENQAIFTRNEKANVKNLSEKEIIEKYRSDIVLLGLSQLDNKDDLKKGQKIRIWYKKLNESSPPKTVI
ncbi:YobA family protein [Bacillus sp. YC2]|nr:YobA family protein [Bacillus sp. YC2]